MGSMKAPDWLLLLVWIDYESVSERLDALLHQYGQPGCKQWSVPEGGSMAVSSRQPLGPGRRAQSRQRTGTGKQARTSGLGYVLDGCQRRLNTVPRPVAADANLPSQHRHRTSSRRKLNPREVARRQDSLNPPLVGASRSAKRPGRLGSLTASVMAAVGGPTTTSQANRRPRSARDLHRRRGRGPVDLHPESLQRAPRRSCGRHHRSGKRASSTLLPGGDRATPASSRRLPSPHRP